MDVEILDAVPAWQLRASLTALPARFRGTELRVRIPFDTEELGGPLSFTGHFLGELQLRAEQYAGTFVCFWLRLCIVVLPFVTGRNW